MADVLSSIGPNIQKYRKLHGLTQKELSEALHIDTMHYSRVERGERQLSLLKLVELCEYFNITMNDLIKIEKSEDDAIEKTKKYTAVCKKLESFTLTQLAVIESVIDAIAPHI